MEQTDKKGIFTEELWQRPGGGGGRSRMLNNANFIEKGHVNFSSVFGQLPEKIINRFQLKSSHDFFSTGVTIDMHPHSPKVPMIHMSLKYFEISNGKKWFCGGLELIPHYINEKQAAYFHHSLKQVCDKHHHSYYKEFNKSADDYYFIRHRNETRGIGGIYFDKLSAQGTMSLDDRFHFVQDTGECFIPVYTKLIHENKDAVYGKQEKKWQLMRRGRFVEFALIYDNDLHFEFETNFRTESLLLSMPPEVQWDYFNVVKKGSAEVRTLELLKKGINWVALYQKKSSRKPNTLRLFDE